MSKVMLPKYSVFEYSKKGSKRIAYSQDGKKWYVLKKGEFVRADKGFQLPLFDEKEDV